MTQTSVADPDYLKKILTARVYDVAVETPLEKAPNLSARLNNTLLLKREDTQSVFSFKLRGAYNKMVRLPREALDRGVICASAGNHAQGVALSAKRLGARAVIVMPVTTPIRARSASSRTARGRGLRPPVVWAALEPAPLTAPPLTAPPLSPAPSSSIRRTTSTWRSSPRSTTRSGSTRASLPRWHATRWSSRRCSVR